MTQRKRWLEKPHLGVSPNRMVFTIGVFLGAGACLPWGLSARPWASLVEQGLLPLRLCGMVGVSGFRVEL